MKDSNHSGSSERSLIDLAWAQVEVLTKVGKPVRSNDSATFGTLPGYRILNEIHRGGQGIVYQAIQESTNRKIAIKVLKEGPFADQTEMARFEREVEILSRLTHPNIVAIHDRGFAAGHAYFVMDYIAGEPLDAHVASAKLSIDETLELFAKVCEAVNVAHLRGVIHRDLKPGNIRVDLEGEPRILDFGLAKLVQEVSLGSTEQNMTMTGQFVGSLPWASPEQATGYSELIDIRTDVYSLGVILYQMLTGHFPYPVSGAVGEVARHIMHSNPARPSTVRGEIKNDLELVLLKCLEKEPGRRYQSAGELARDIRHYLADEPVSATSPSAVYRLRKFVRRNRGAVTAVGLVALALVVGAAVSLVFAVKASKALAVAEEQSTLAKKNEQEMRQVARFQSALLENLDVQAMGLEFKRLYRDQVQDSLSRQFVGEWPDRRKMTPEEIQAELAAFDRITGPTQSVDVARRVMDDFILGNDIETVNSNFAKQPNVRAELLFNLGKISGELGLNDKAVDALRQSLELRRADATCDGVVLADTLTNLAVDLGATGKNDEAEKLHREALALFRVHLGDGHYKTIQSMNNIADCLFDRGDYAGGEAMLRETVALGRSLPEDAQDALAHALSDLAAAILNRGDHAAAEPFAREALELGRRMMNQEADDSVNDLEASPVAITKRASKNALTASNSLNTLAGVFYMRQEYEQSGELLRECLEIKRKHLGDEHVEVATIINNLGGIAWRMGDRDSAKAQYGEALAMYRRLLGDEHPHVAGTLNNVAMMNQMDGKLDVSGPMLREALELRRRVLEPDHADLSLSIANLALQLEKEEDLSQAESLYREAVAINTKKLDPCHNFRVSAEVGLTRVLRKQGKLDEMEKLLNDFYPPVKESNPDQPCFIDYVKCYVRLYDEKELLSPGQGFAAKADEWRATTQPVEEP